MRNDQVKISFGPARYDSPKAIRKQIEDAKQETQESTIQEITNNPDISVGGRSGFLGDVTAYDPSDRSGTATSDGVNYEFTNSTGTALDIGDEVIINEIDDEYYVVGVTDRVGDITPVPLPAAAAISPNFPLRTDNLSFPIHANRDTGKQPARTFTGRNYAFDMFGYYGIGTDTIIGQNTNSTTAINSFTRPTSVNASLFPQSALGSTESSMFVNPSGYLLQLVTSGTGIPSIYYRDQAASSWSTYSVGGTVGGALTDRGWVYDDYSGWAWSCSFSGSVLTFHKFAPGDTTPSSTGSNLGVAFPTASPGVRLFAGFGYLIAQVYSSTTISTYMKAAGDTTNFVLTSGSAVASWSATTAAAEVNPNGDVTYIYENVGTSTYHLRYLESATGIVYNYDMNIASRVANGTLTNLPSCQAHSHTASGLVIVAGQADGALVGTADPYIFPFVAAFNYVASTIVWYDPTLYYPSDNTAGVPQVAVTTPVEVSAGALRFGTSTSSLGTGSGWPTGTRIIELTGL